MNQCLFQRMASLVKMYKVCLPLLLFAIANAQLQCRDEENNPVDWYVMYKIPKLKRNANHLIQNGLAYAFITSKNVAKSWTLSTLSIGDPLSMVGHTLQPLYNHANMSNLLWITYNDEPPANKKSEELGHTKGVVMADTGGGVWLVHSVPLFPPPPVHIVNGSEQRNNYSYPHTGTHYGQSFLCISLNTQQMDTVGVQLTYNEPDIYGKNVPVPIEHLMPHLSAAARNTRVAVAPWFHQTQITSRGGQTFQSFAKSSHFNKELYADWVAVSLRVNLLVESWLNGHGALPSDCKHTYKVENIGSVYLDAAHVNFTNHVDHSKWTVAEDKVVPWVCVGDINRMAGQEVRGGGTVCIKNSQLWTSYRQIVSSVDPCPAKITTRNEV